MEGTIVNFRGGRHTQYSNQMVIAVKDISQKEKAAELIGKKVTWLNSKGNAITGKVSNAHGNKGAVRAVFEKGMPGQSLGTKVTIE
ncbi:50S ribosomal protein L35ae [Candidatus Woesearchaeota archaeon]|nr:50S ribosomal protein L35ae [Candidatus Woesearchaeota archaeon]